MVLHYSQWNLNQLQIVIGIAALALGVALYIFDRPSSLTYLVPDLFSQYEGKPVMFGVIGNHLPTFFHAFAFCLLTAGVLGSKIRGAFFICLFWCLIDGTFEIAQHPDIANKIITFIPDWFNNIPVLENTADYFLHGRFDQLDLVAILMGSVMAFGLIFFLHVVFKKD